MKTTFPFFAIVVVFLLSCDRIDKSLISDSEKLNSPSGKLTLYRYYIENSMSFGSGFMAINISNSTTNYDYTNPDVFRLDNDSPFWIKWKNEDTLMVKCILNVGEISSYKGGFSENKSVKKEFKKWKDWTFEVEYFLMFSTGIEADFLFDNYSIDNNSITFKSKKDSLVIKMNEVQFSLDTNRIFVTEFKIDTLQSKKGLSFSHYHLLSPKGYNKNDFLKQQAFSRTKP